MPSIFVTDSKLQQREIELQSGLTLMELLRDEGYEEIAAICGGGCACATCHLHVVESPTPLLPVEEDEALLLELADDYEPNLSRLSCQIELDESMAGMQVRLVANS